MVGDKVAGNYYALLPIFIIERNTKFQLEIGGNKDVIFLPSNTDPLF